MYRQKESELNAIFRDTEGHETSVKLKFAYAAFSFAALTLFHYATHYVFLIYTLVLYGIPLQLLFSALSEIVHHRKAKARQLAGFDDLPEITFNADDGFDAKGRLRADRPSVTPFIRHHP